jgi:hypothetical protein
MNSNDFKAIITQQVDRSMAMLQSKNAHYNPNADKLKAFKTAAALQNETPREALAGMMAKHTTSVYDLCNAESLASLDVWNEKITDHINYLLLLRAVVEEETVENSYNDDVKEDLHLTNLVPADVIRERFSSQL